MVPMPPRRLAGTSEVTGRHLWYVVLPASLWVCFCSPIGMISMGILILALALAGWLFSAPWPMLAFFLASMAFILVVQLAIVARCMRSSSRWVGLCDRGCRAAC